MTDGTTSVLWSWLPRAWREPLAVAGRDLAHLRRRLGGEAIAQTVTRPARAVTAAAPRAAAATRRMELTAVTRETADAVSLTLTPRDGLPVTFEAGQFLTLEVPIEGVTHRRAYSISSAATDRARVTVTVKRVPGGLVSNRLHDHAKTGDTLAVSGPSGGFTLGPAEGSEHAVLVAGGSGITPLMAILRTQLAGSAGRRFTLVYGNRGPGDVIFRDALAALAAEHPARLALVEVFEAPPEGWAGERGRLDEATCGRIFDGLGVDDDARWMLCGPAPMMVAARAALAARGVPAERVREERFFTPTERRATAAATATATRRVTLRLATGERRVEVPPGVTVLDAGLAAGVELPFSCTMGGCGACRVKVTAGELAVDEPNCLTPAERAAGYALACCARAVTDATVEVAP